MSRYDAMASIPPSVERAVIKSLVIRRALARESHSPYCFRCDQPFKSPEALEQHTRDKHGKTQ